MRLSSDLRTLVMTLPGWENALAPSMHLPGLCRVYCAGPLLGDTHSRDPRTAWGDEAEHRLVALVQQVFGPGEQLDLVRQADARVEVDQRVIIEPDDERNEAGVSEGEVISRTVVAGDKAERKSVGKGKSGSGRVGLGGGRNSKKKKKLVTNRSL